MTVSSLPTPHPRQGPILTCYGDGESQRMKRLALLAEVLRVHFDCHCYADCSTDAFADIARLHDDKGQLTVGVTRQSSVHPNVKAIEEVATKAWELLDNGGMVEIHLAPPWE